MQAVVVSEAGSAEELIVRAALASAGVPGMPIEPFIARDGPDGRLLGVSVLSSVTARSDVPGPGFAWRVIAPDAGDNVTAAMVGDACARAWRWGADAVYSLGAFDEHDEACAAWRSAGFEARTDRERFRAPVAAVAEHCGALLARAEAAGKIPEGLVVTRADRVEPERLSRLHARAFGGSLAAARRAVVERPGLRLVPSCSPVVLRDGHAVGYLLVTHDRDDRLVIPAVAVDPEHRGSAIELLLMAESARDGMREGRRRIEFEAGPENTMTRRAAARFGGEVVSRRVYFVRPADEPEGASG